MMLFVNLPTNDLPRAMAFWRALGFDFNPDYTDDTAACLVFSEHNYAMLLTAEKWAEFAPGPIADPGHGREVMVTIQLESQKAVSTAVAAAITHGGAAFGEARDLGFMYQRAITDPDGHVWELTWFAPQS